MSGDYRLDDLGWFQFERLCQALLRAQHGASLEAWGGGADFGRDAYSEGPLYFPDPQVETNGPFIFQVKFVAGASAAGADPWPALKKAVKSELKRISERVDADQWEDPAVYVLMTNTPIKSSTRRELRKLLDPALPDTKIVLQGAGDLYAALDASPAVRRAYPQVLGLRDLELLIRNAVSADVWNRSTAAVASLSALPPVFVATGAYRRTLGLLDRYRFAVLTGPPEMGKTATAWMVALARMSGGWEVHDCRSPRDLFQVYDKDIRQVFVADDAFGSTEYRPEIATEWAAQLSKVLAFLNRDHVLLWTSRPGPLALGLERLHFDGADDRFPAPHQVTVDASYLTIEEKAQILYRHARAAGLNDKARSLVRSVAPTVVWSPHFTPYRIKRFVEHRLPDLVADGTLDENAVKEAVRESLAETSKAMKTSLNVLSLETRSLLISMLNAPPGAVDLDETDELLRDYLGGAPGSSTEKLAALIDDHFIKVQDRSTGVSYAAARLRGAFK